SARIVSRLTTALRTVQILGQILKNFPGSISADQKELIATECYALGFRALRSVLGMLEADKQLIVRHLVETMRAHRPGDEEEKLVRRANSAVFGLALISSYGIVKRISF